MRVPDAAIISMSSLDGAGEGEEEGERQGEGGGQIRVDFDAAHQVRGEDGGAGGCSRSSCRNFSQDGTSRTLSC